MHHYLYEVTNKLNGKIYIGVHSTENLDDGYMGSGRVIQRAIKKHGAENFTKTILETFLTKEAMFAREKEVVTESFLTRKDVYNLRRGGNGGFDHINNNVPLRIDKNQKANRRLREEYSDQLSEWGQRGGRSAFEKHGLNKKWFQAGRTSMLGKTHTPETKQRMSVAHYGKHDGILNSQHGTRWVTNGETDRKIKIDESLPEGWNFGRNQHSKLLRKRLGSLTGEATVL